MPSRLYKFLLVLGMLAVLASIPIFYFHKKDEAQNKNLEAVFLDVGQGDAVLIKTPFGQNILIDGGPDDSVLYGLGGHLDWWDRRIDLMILTHPHDDHVAGLVDVAKRYRVGEVIYSGVVHTAPNYLEWLRLIREKNIHVKLIEKPSQIILGPDCWLDILYPDESFFQKEVGNLNNTSLVVKLTYQDTSFLFVGDIEKEVEDRLLTEYSSLSSADGGTLDVDVLKIAHHGSNTSSSEDFLNAVRPKISIIMAGTDNKFGHPSNRILKRLERINSEIYRTDINGEITILSDGDVLRVFTEY